MSLSLKLRQRYEYTKQRKNFGRQTLFQCVPAQILDSINPSQEDQQMYILRNPVHQAIQAVQPMSQNEVNTPLKITREQGINHVEGGWPREVHSTNEEHRQRHRRRVMHDDGYCDTIFNVAPTLEHYIDQNNAIEMYETYFTHMRPQESIESQKISILNVFHDKFQRPVSSVKFTNEKNAKLAVAYCFKTCQEDPTLNNQNECFLWDVRNQSEPVVKLLPDYPCWQIDCSPVTPELLLFGLKNGTVNVFDIRTSKKAVSSSLVFYSHSEAVSSLRFIHSRTHTDFFSGSSDGQCLWWDLRNLSKPLDQLLMSIRIAPSDQPSLNNAEGVSFLEYDFGLPTKFLCGTESGLVINVNRLGKSHSDKLVSYWHAHDGPVQSVQRSMCTFGMFITCGDHTVRIWSEDVRTRPIITSNPYKHVVTDVCWLPQRYSTYMSTCAGGFFYYWDLLQKYNEPIKTLRVSKDALTKMTVHIKGESVAIGDNKGSLYLIKLSENMALAGPRDKTLMQQIYERETRREHILDNRLKEIRLKAHKEDLHPSNNVPVDAVDDEDVEQATQEEYFRIVQDQCKEMDILPNSE